MSATAALTSLLRQTSITDHDEALHVANAALRGNKLDYTAQHTRIVALLKLDRFDDALRALAETGVSLSEKCVVERAYCLYKLGRLGEARNMVSNFKGPSDSRVFKHLRAQIAYRGSDFREAAILYDELTSGTGLAGEENDVRINLLATETQRQWNEGRQLDRILVLDASSSRGDLEAFETSYNSACGCIARGELAKAGVLLKRARDLCENSDELGDEEKKVEDLAMAVQLVYVLAAMGKVTEAETIMRNLKVADIPESPTKAVALNNQQVLQQQHASADGFKPDQNQKQNSYQSQRLIQSAAQLIQKGNDQLFHYQAAILRRNQHVLHLHTQKFGGVQSSTLRSISQKPEPSLAVLNAAAHAHMQEGPPAIRALLPVLEKQRPTDLGLLLTLIQLHVKEKHLESSLRLLQSFQQRLENSNDLQGRFAPALVATAVSLFHLLRRPDAIRTELARAATHWGQCALVDDMPLRLLQAAGVQLLKSSNPEHLTQAGSTFESLSSRQGTDAKSDADLATAGMVASFATTDYPKIEPLLDALVPVDRLTAGIDVEALVAGGVVAPISAAITSSSITRKRGVDETNNSSRKRRRKQRLPKSYEEGKTPDLERWLPLRDRSTYRPKGKRGKKRAGEALTQGGVVKEEILELAGGAGAVKVEKATGSASGGGGGGKKKGKKRK